MAKWVFDQWDNAMEYPTLGFHAQPGDILDAVYAPDARWSLNANQSAAETVFRFPIGGDPYYVEPTDGHVLTYDAEANTYVPTAPEMVGTPSVEGALADVDANPTSEFRVQQDARLETRIGFVDDRIDNEVASLNAEIDNQIAAEVTRTGNTYARKRERDPRDFGLTGGVDDSAALQAAVSDAGPGGTVVLPDDLTIRYRNPITLPTGIYGLEVRGSGVKGSTLQSDVDVACFTAQSGHGWTLRNMVIQNTTVARTTYDIDFTNPTKPVLEDVEVDLNITRSGVGGGVRLRRDTGLSGNSFMPQLSRVWIRQGSLTLDGVSDGHFTDGFVWAADGAAAAINANDAPLWTFTGVDVVPSDGAGTGYLFQNTNGAQIVGGYIDGSYADNPTGYGIRAVNSHRIIATGHQFFNLGRSGVLLESSSGCVFTGCAYYNNNKQDGGYPDIELVGSGYNTFTNSTHSHPAVRTNKGGVYREDSGSLHNLLDASAIDLAVGNQYASLLAVVNAGTLGRRNRPASLWPRPSGVPWIITPPAATMGIGAPAAWPAVNRAQFHRFNVADGGVYRYANVRVEVASGNMQCAVVRMDGLNYTRVMDSGVIAAVAGNQAIDMGGYTYLAPGEYALVVWCDNTTAQFSRASGEVIRGSRMVTEVSSLAGGVPASGAIASWSSGTTVLGLSLAY